LALLVLEELVAARRALLDGLELPRPHAVVGLELLVAGVRAELVRRAPARGLAQEAVGPLLHVLVEVERREALERPEVQLELPAELRYVLLDPLDVVLLLVGHRDRCRGITARDLLPGAGPRG